MPAAWQRARLQTQALFSLPFLALAGGGAAAWTADGSLSAAAARALEWGAQLSAVQGALLAFSATTAVSGTLLQFRGQRTVPAAAAQPIYASAPILSAAWAFLVLREPVSASEVLGGLGVCTAAALATGGEARSDDARRRSDGDRS